METLAMDRVWVCELRQPQTNAFVSRRGFLSELDAKQFFESKRNIQIAVDLYYAYPYEINLGSGRLAVNVDCVDESGLYYTLRIRAKRIVCETCNGEGTVLRSSLRGVAFSPEEMDEDFRRSYFGGDYDEYCPECGGERVTLAPDLDVLPANMREDYERLREEIRRSDLEAEAECRYFERASRGTLG